MAFLILAVLILTGCGSRAQDPLVQSVRAAVQNVGQTPAAPTPVAQQRLAIIQAIRDAGAEDPILLVALPERSAVATLGVGGDNLGVITWIDAGGVSVALKNGVIVSTRGLGHDLIVSDVSGSVAALKMKRSSHTREQRYLNGEGQLHGIELSCAAELEAKKVTETCHSETRRVVNTYELKHNRVIRSRQWLGPELGYAEIEQLQ
ncbi:MAG: YjbF family lipoprotein [Aliishimia sp.]